MWKDIFSRKYESSKYGWDCDLLIFVLLENLVIKEKNLAERLRQKVNVWM